MSTSGRTGILNGELQNDLSAEGFGIENLSFVGFSEAGVESAGLSKNIFLSTRTDGKDGSGVELDPFNASTLARLDALWPSIVSDAPKSVTFLPGTYLTNGQLSPISNCIIRYHGATIRLDTTAGVTGGKRSVFWSNSVTQITNCVFDGGFTGVLDSNGANQAASEICVGGIEFWGSHCKILGTKFIGFATTNATAEVFVASIFTSATAGGSGNEIAWNEFTDPADITHAFAITLFCVHGYDIGTSGYPGPRWTYSDKLHHNYAHDMDMTFSGIGTLNGAQPGSGSVGQEISHNTFSNITVGTAIYADTGHAWNCVITDNIISNVQRGITLSISLENSAGNGHTWNNLTIENNMLSIQPGNPSYGITLDGGPFPGAVVRENQVYRYGSSDTVQAGYSLRYIQNGKVEGNLAGTNVTANSLGHSTNPLIKDNTWASLTDEGNNTGVVKTGNRTLAGVRLDAPGDRTELGLGASSGIDITNITGPLGIGTSATANLRLKVMSTGVGHNVFEILSASGAGNISILDFTDSGHGYLQIRDAVGAATIGLDGSIGAITGTYDKRGTGSPEGVVTAPVGAIYRRTDGGASTVLYLKEIGSGNTGWAAYGVAGASGGTVTQLNFTDGGGFDGTVTSATTTPTLSLALTSVADSVLSTAIKRLAAVTTALGAGTAIDWALTTTFSKTLSANTVFTWSNDTDGYDISVLLTNTAGNYTVTWPAGIKWKDAGTPVQTVGVKSDLYGFKKIGSTIYGAVIQNYTA